MVMVRDQRREWPADTPPGTFDIGVGGLRRSPSHGGELEPGVTAHILFVCPNRRRCAVFLGPVAREPLAADSVRVWGWDGNLERPTLNPSINCAGGCGWHGSIAAGTIN